MCQQNTQDTHGMFHRPDRIACSAAAPWYKVLVVYYNVHVSIKSLTLVRRLHTNMLNSLFGRLRLEA